MRYKTTNTSESTNGYPIQPMLIRGIRIHLPVRQNLGAGGQLGIDYHHE